MTTFEHIQDAIGQLPLLKSYTHILLCFPLLEGRRDGVLDSIQSAVRKVVAAFPFLRGKVVTEGLGPNTSGTFKVIRCEAWESPSHQFVRVVDRSSICASYDQIREAQAPSFMLPGSQLGGRVAFPEQYRETECDPAPVLDIQANLIRGGLLLDIAAQHNIIDATGIFQIANLIALSMRDETIPDAMIDEGNRDRRRLIPLLGPDETLLDHSELMPSKTLPNDTATDFIRGYKWQLLRLSVAALNSIIADGRRQPEEFVPSVTSVSTNDCLTAFLWKRVTAMRLRRDHNPQAISKISRAVDLRRVMGLSPAYMGHMIRIANTSLTFQEIISSSLSKLASLLRQTVVQASDMYAVRSYVTFISNQSDKSRIAYAGTFNPSTDMSCSSIAHVTVPRFGELGIPEFVTRPTFGPLPSCAYFGAESNGGYATLMCLHEYEFQALYHDKEWSDLVRCVG
ncbi:hypothetical protein BDV59DRAFT_208016 [Aspergillus ambiguus]|uniref:uncharacterized protein n=1 Tax=Aspergillus ambiguus TaxID=176160 RepID=UPI003CCD1501